jgi:molecular chaperone DnaK (HSP70)
MKGDVKDDLKAMAKIRKNAEKAKEVLTANKELPLTIESLFNDIDYKVKLNRETFYESSASLLKRVIAPVEEALRQANLTKVGFESF